MRFDPNTSRIQREDRVEAGHPEVGLPVRDSSWEVG